MAILLLSGCVSAGISTPEQASAGTQIEHDKYRQVTYVTGPSLIVNSPSYQRWQILTSLNDRGEIIASWIEYGETTDSGHSYYRAAHDDLGHGLRVETLDRERATRSIQGLEEVAVHFPEGYLREHLHTGIDVQLEGRRGDTVIKIGTNYIAGYWSKLLIAQACVKDHTC